MSVKRYDDVGYGVFDMGPDPDGEWVKHSDYAALEAKCAALAAENAGMKSAIDTTIGWQQSTDPENAESVRMLVDIKTPATDSFLAEVRATAITDALEECSEYLITDCVMDRLGISYEDAELRSSGAIELDEALICVANQLRQDANTAELVAAGIITKVGE